MKLFSSGMAPSDSVFNLRLESTRLQIASSDSVTAVAASGDLLWVGTQSGRLIRHDTQNNQTDQLRGRLGVGRLDNPVCRVYADPHTHAALIILRNADGYYAHGTGPVRPRWLAKLRGLRCQSASWIRLPSSSAPMSNVALLGTALGALFSLTIDSKYEKDDHLAKLWAAPNGEKIDGIRVEHVAGKFVATIATTSTLYLFSDALSLSDLFNDNHMTVLSRAETPHLVTDTIEPSELLPSELQFMTGNSGLASRRFVWAAAQGVTHAQLAVRRRRTDRASASHVDHVSRPFRSTVMASVVDKATIPWSTLKETTGSSVPLACNLSAFHVLVLYPGSVYAFNHISGQLTQRIVLWNPNSTSSNGERSIQERPHGTPRSRRGVPQSPELSSTPLSGRDAKRASLTWEEPSSSNQFLSSPASGFARDVCMDSLWLYTADGEFARLISSSEEQTEAWKAAKSMGRFDLAMALAPLVSSGMPDVSTIIQTREAVLEAQADHAASDGNWDVAAQLYAKTNRPIETVILRIVEACSTSSDTESSTMEESSLTALGIGNRLQVTRHIITYLVRKLDRTDASKPTQRTIIATMLVQLYASQLSSEVDRARKEDVRKDFGYFLADRHQDLDTSTSLSILARNGCYDEAWTLAVLSGDFLSAADMSSRLGNIDRTLSLLKNKTVVTNNDTLSQLVGCLSHSLIPRSPERVTSAIARSLRKESQYVNHITLVQGLARVSREVKNSGKSREAYKSATNYLFDILHDWKNVTGKGGTGDASIDDSPQDWYNLATFLFQLHAEFGSEAEAQRSYDHLVVPHVKRGMRKEITDALGVILRSCQSAGFQRLCVFLYQALGLLETAISQAVEIDVGLAETELTQLSMSDVPENLKKSLWCLVARRSEDAVGVVERSKGVLHIEDVLTNMTKFECATERIKTAVANSLEEHKRLATCAKSNAVAALEVTRCLREDVEKAKDWQQERQVERHRHRYRAFSCGHKMRTAGRSSEDRRECALCGSKAVDSIDSGFGNGYTLPVKARGGG